MPISDDAQILQVPLKARGAKADDWASVRVNDLTQLNAVLRQVQEQINKLTGRTGDSAIRSGLTVAGDLTVSGALSGSNLTLGGGLLTPSDPSFAPTVEAALTPRALDYSPLLGAQADLLAASPFTWTLSEHFIGGQGTGVANLGELGWSIAGVPSVARSAGEANHPGILNIDDTGTLYLESSVFQADLSYIGMVVRPFAKSRVSFRFGFITPSASVDSGMGAYFYIASSTNPVWGTVTRNSTTVLSNVSTLPVNSSEWALLEIVLTADAVDFYFNRERLFRHQGASVDATTFGNLGFDQETMVGTPNGDYDRFIAAGRGTDKIWT